MAPSAAGTFGTVMSAMTQANTRTTSVRMAVATSESVLRMPHFARMDVRPAKSADATAAAIHVGGHLEMMGMHTHPS